MPTPSPGRSAPEGGTLGIDIEFLIEGHQTHLVTEGDIEPGAACLMSRPRLDPPRDLLHDLQDLFQVLADRWGHAHRDRPARLSRGIPVRVRREDARRRAHLLRTLHHQLPLDPEGTIGAGEAGSAADTLRNVG